MKIYSEWSEKEKKSSKCGCTEENTLLMSGVRMGRLDGDHTLLEMKC